MPSQNELSLTIGFDVDDSDLQKVVQQQAGELGREFKGVESNVQSLQRMLQDLVRPMQDMRDMAKEMSESFKQAKDAARDIRESIASTRLHTGTGGAGGGGDGGGGGLGITDLLRFGRNPISSILSSVSGSTMLGGAGLGLAGIGLALPAVGAAYNWATNAGRQALGAALPSDQPVGRFMAPLQAIAQGASPLEVMQQDPYGMGGAYGTVRGLMSGIGQGPVGLAANIVGGGWGAAGGVRVGGQIAETLGINRGAGQLVGAEMGRQMMTGTLERYINEAMQRYPGFVAQTAAMATPGLYGGDWRQLRGLRPARYGYGPEQSGAEFGALYQGYGGGELTMDNARVAMQYSRAYGVGMGQIGQAMGGILNIGGGGQFATAEQREHMTLRVMTDAIAAGFGRRLPEFASAVSTGVGIAVSGPGMIRQADMAELSETISRITGRVATERGVGLQQAGRFLAPIIGAPGGMMRGVLGGGGDPFAMAQLMATSRGRFGGDQFQMMFGERGLLAAQADPTGIGLEFLAPMLRNQLRTSGSPYGAAVGMSQTFRGLGVEATPDMIRDLVVRGGALQQQARSEGRDITDEEMLELLQDIIHTNEDEGDSMENTMREVGAASDRVMREQLAPLANWANLQEAERARTAAMISVGEQFYQDQLRETTAMARAIEESNMREDLRAIHELRREGVSILQGGDVAGYIEHMARGLWTRVRTAGGPLDRNARDAPVAPPATVREFQQERVVVERERRHREAVGAASGRLPPAESPSEPGGLSVDPQYVEGAGGRVFLQPSPPAGRGDGAPNPVRSLSQ